jgi:hypothetical protein
VGFYHTFKPEVTKQDKQYEKTDKNEHDEVDSGAGCGSRTGSL